MPEWALLKRFQMLEAKGQVYCTFSQRDSQWHQYGEREGGEEPGETTPGYTIQWVTGWEQ